MTKPRSLVLPVLGLTLFLAPLPVSAAEDCTRFPKRPATAEEKKIYADGYALFLRMAPAAPAGWDSSDAQKSGTLNEVCAPASEQVITHGFDTRAFTPVTVGTSPAFRQLTAAQGGMPASAQFVVVLGGAAGPRTVVTVGGDPARAEALLKAARLQ